jgi:hypothetical protein
MPALQCDAYICDGVFGVAGVFSVAWYGRAAAIPLNRRCVLHRITLHCIGLRYCLSLYCTVLRVSDSYAVIRLFTARVFAGTAVLPRPGC